MSAQPISKQIAPALQRSAQVFAPIQREFDRLFDQMAEGWGRITDIALSTRLDVKDTDDGIEITLEAPGVDRDDVSISVEDNVVTISGEKKADSQRKEGGYRIAERMYGAFSRSIALPGGVDADKITASMDKGVLKLTAPRDGKARAKTIPIQTTN